MGKFELGHNTTVCLAGFLISLHWRTSNLLSKFFNGFRTALSENHIGFVDHIFIFCPMMYFYLHVGVFSIYIMQNSILFL